MKNKITQKFIMNNYKNVIRVGYCDLQYLLNFETLKYYTSGAYGWNADIYQIDNDTVIVTGYRPFGNIRNKYNINKFYNTKASEVLASNITYEEKREKIKILLENYIKEVLL